MGRPSVRRMAPLPIVAILALSGCATRSAAQITAADVLKLIPPGAIVLEMRKDGEPVSQSVLADLDGDGRKEAAVCYNHPVAGFAGGWFEVFGAGRGEARSLLRRRIPWSPSLKRLKKGEGVLRAADLTGDGRPEVLLVTSGLNVFTMRAGKVAEVVGPWGRTPEDSGDRRAGITNSVGQCEVQDIDGAAPPELVLEDNWVGGSFYGLDVFRWDGEGFRAVSATFPDLFKRKLAELGEGEDTYWTYETGVARAQMLYYAGRRDESVEFVSRNRKKTGNLGYNLFLAEVALQEGRLEDAFGEYQALGRTEDIYGHLSLTYRRMGRAELAEQAGEIAVGLAATKRALHKSRPGPPDRAEPIIARINGGWDVKELYVQNLARPRLEEMLAAFKETHEDQEEVLERRFAEQVNALAAHPDDGLANDIFGKLFAELSEAKTREEWEGRSRGGDADMFLCLLDTNCGVDALIEGTKSAHPVVRQIATTALARTGSERALRRLRELLRAPTDGLDEELFAAAFPVPPGGGAEGRLAAFGRAVREAATMGLVHFRAEEAVPLLTERLGVAGDDEKRTLLRALGEMKANSAVPAIAPLLKHPKLKHAALDALKRIGSAKTERALLAASEKKSLRQDVAYKLAEMGTEQSVPALASALEEAKGGNLPIFIIRGLGRIGGKAAADVLLLHIETGEHRRELVLALGRAGDERAVKPILGILAELAEKKDRGLRTWKRDGEIAACARALGELGCKPAIPELRRILSSVSPLVRLEALGALMKLGEKERVSELPAFLDPRKLVPETVRGVSGLRRDAWLRQCGKKVKARAAELLVNTGQVHNATVVLDHLAEHWDDRDSYFLQKKLREIAPDMVPAILEYLKWRDPTELDRMTWFLIDLLASAKDARAVPVLKRAYDLAHTAQERLGNGPGWEHGIQKTLALTLTELTGEEYKYLRMIPFE